MAQITYRANLSSTFIPLTTISQGRSVIVKQYDSNFLPQVTSDKDLDKDTGVPQILYAHNVLPTGDGFQSVDFNSHVAPPAGALRFFTQIVSVRNTDGEVAYIGATASGAMFYYRAPNYQWTQFTTFAGSPPPAINMTVAQVAGENYICVANEGVYTFNFTTNTWENKVLLGVDMQEVIGITAAQGYLIAYSKDSVTWGSLLDPLDMEPSLVTGAGGGTVEQIRGRIIVCVYNITGFIIYTTANAVAAVYSGNEQYPFNFREVSNSGGILASHYVATESNSGTHYAFTTSGLQQISPVETRGVFGEVTDFLTSKIFEDFDNDTNTFTTTVSPNALLKAVNVIADRYLVISYGLTYFTHAIVYDMVLERFGKLKIPHIQVFEWLGHRTVDADVAKTSFGFLLSNGQILTLNQSPNPGDYVGAPEPAILFGKFQFVRSRYLQLDCVDVESIRDTDTFTCHSLTSWDGKTFNTPAAGYLDATGAWVRKFLFKLVGMNHSILFKGKFSLSSLVLRFSVHGER